jgi:hypothetical protein
MTKGGESMCFAPVSQRKQMKRERKTKVEFWRCALAQGSVVTVGRRAPQSVHMRPARSNHTATPFAAPEQLC